MPAQYRGLSAGRFGRIMVERVPALERLGPYRLLRALGSGAMGTVYLAEERRTGGGWR